jgi:phosphomannomutase/phosphoglucomutase
MNRRFRVAADCGGGAASMVVPALLNALEVQTELLYCEPDGLFTNRLPEPKEANLKQLIQTVKKRKLDVGMAWDGDADRIIFITDQGRYLMGDRAFALAAYHSLRDLQEQPKHIVTQVATSDVIHDVARLIDAEIVETRVGEPFIVQAMKSKNAVIGGEENGGVIYRGWSWTREGMLTALKILDLMELEDKTLEELDGQFPTYYQVKESVHCGNRNKDALLELIKGYVPSDTECSTIDGIKLRYTDGWVLLRPSGTEPIFRVFAEAKTETRAKTLVKQGLKIVSEALEEVKSK